MKPPQPQRLRRSNQAYLTGCRLAIIGAANGLRRLLWEWVEEVQAERFLIST